MGDSVNVVKQGLTEKETFQDTLEGSERRNHVVSCRVSIPGIERAVTAQAQSGSVMAYSGDSREAAWVQGSDSGKVSGNSVRGRMES